MSSANTPSSPHRPGVAWSVALRLTAWYVGSSFVILVVACVALYLILVGNIRRAQDQYLVDKIRVIRELLKQHPDGLAELKEEVEQDWAPRQYIQVYARVVGDDGRMLAESPRMGRRLHADEFPPPVELGVQPEHGVQLWATISDPGKPPDPVRAMSARVQRGADGSRTAVVQVALDVQRAHILLAGYRQTLMLVLGIGLAVCAAAGYWLVRTSLRPLREIAATAERIRSSNLEERIELRGLPAELSTLAFRFNGMLDRLQDSFDRLGRFSADIAHEMRTPVNNMRIEIDVALGKARTVDEYRETLGSILEECGRLTRIIESLLFIARAEDPRTQIRTEVVDVGRELGRVRDFYEAAAEEAGVELMVSCPPGATAPLDRTLFQRAVSNLVANALRYTPRGGRVTMTAARENGQMRVDVADTGAGIAPADLPRIFDRFYRADRARSTSAAGNVGLGLAIVKSIVAMHGGTIDADSAPRAGTRMTIRVPAEAAAPAEPPDAEPAPEAAARQ